MTARGGMLLGDQRVDEDGRIGGMIRGALTVGAGRRVDVAGMISGGLVLEPGAELLVSGMVNGPIDNRGGTVRVTGMATG